MKLSDIAQALNARIDNASPDTEITGVAGIEQAGRGQLTFVSNPKYNAAAKTTKASAVIVAENFPALSTGMLRSKNPYLAWAKAIEVLLDIHAESGETSRMIGVADLAIEKMAKSNLSQKEIDDKVNTFNLKIAEALFAAGDTKASRTKMEAVGTPSSPKLKAEADRLRRFLAIGE